MKTDGEFLSNLRFADDIFLCTEITQELQQLCYKNYQMKIGEWVLKGHCIEFKYYADGIHSGLTPPG